MISQDDARAELSRLELRHRARRAGVENDLIRAVALGTAVPDELVRALPAARSGSLRVAEGWLLWVTDAPEDENRRGTGARFHLVEERGTVRVHRWPAWPVSTIVDRIRASDGADRFPPLTVAVLEDAGWFPGRALTERVLDAWLQDRQQLEGVRLHEAALAALREFGALRLRADDVCDVEFFPHPVTPSRWNDASSIAEWAGVAVFPVAQDHRERAEGLVVVLEEPDDLPGVVVAGDTDQYSAGATVDDMIISYTTGAQLPPAG